MLTSSQGGIPEVSVFREHVLLQSEQLPASVKLQKPKQSRLMSILSSANVIGISLHFPFLAQIGYDETAYPVIVSWSCL